MPLILLLALGCSRGHDDTITNINADVRVQVGSDDPLGFASETVEYRRTDDPDGSCPDRTILYASTEFSMVQEIPSDVPLEVGTNSAATSWLGWHGETAWTGFVGAATFEFVSDDSFELVFADVALCQWESITEPVDGSCESLTNVHVSLYTAHLPSGVREMCGPPEPDCGLPVDVVLPSTWAACPD